MNRNRIIQLARITFGLLGLSAVITELLVLNHRGDLVATHFFGYFTILSNCLAGAWLLYQGLTSQSRQRPRVMVRGAVTLYMLMTGVIFAILLAPIENAVLTAVPWDNIVLHYIMPLVVLLDWLIDPPRIMPTYKRALLWLTFPLVYVMFSLVRGASDGWYPYPFLNATKLGYAHVAATSVIMLVGILAAIWLLLQAHRFFKIKGNQR